MNRGIGCSTSTARAPDRSGSAAPATTILSGQRGRRGKGPARITVEGMTELPRAPATVEVPRSLADDLRSRDDAALAALLRARPDLINPVPGDLGVLAVRAATRSSVSRALDRLDRFTLQTVDVLCVLPDPATTAAVERAARRPGRGAGRGAAHPGTALRGRRRAAPGPNRSGGDRCTRGTGPHGRAGPCPERPPPAGAVARRPRPAAHRRPGDRGRLARRAAGRPRDPGGVAGPERPPGAGRPGPAHLGPAHRAGHRRNREVTHRLGTYPGGAVAGPGAARGGRPRRGRAPQGGRPAPSRVIGCTPDPAPDPPRLEVTPA